jgi:multicomponent Na+:H+ antiporter subunit E
MPRVAVTRAACFLAFWILIAGTETADLIVGVLAAVVATWASLRLLPPGPRRLSFFALARQAPRFVYQSIVAGFEVAWRALDPRLPLAPGFVIYRPRLPPGATQNTFCTIMAMLPGTLPSGTDENGGLVIHCLDKNQPVAEQLAEEEALLMRALRSENTDG